MKHQIGTERKIKSSDTEREALYSNFSGIIKVVEGLPNLLRVFREGLA